MLVPNTMLTTMPTASAIASASGRPLERSAARTGEHGDGDQELRAQQDAPAQRPEQPLPEEQEQADRDEEGDEDEARRRESRRARASGGPRP